MMMMMMIHFPIKNDGLTIKNGDGRNHFSRHEFGLAKRGHPIIQDMGWVLRPLGPALFAACRGVPEWRSTHH